MPGSCGCTITGTIYTPPLFKPFSDRQAIMDTGSYAFEPICNTDKKLSILEKKQIKKIKQFLQQKFRQVSFTFYNAQV
jgi:hypothetical protein